MRRVRALEKQLKVLSDENEELKSMLKTDIDAIPHEKTPEEKKAEKMMGYVPMQQCSLFDEDGKK